MKDFIEKLDDLEKAMRDGVKGKYRRMDGKTVFIRSEDKKVTKGPNHLRGKKVVMKEAVTTEGMSDDLGSPSAEVNLTNEGRKKRKSRFDTSTVVKSLQEGLQNLEKVLNELSSPDVRSDGRENRS